MFFFKISDEYSHQFFHSLFLFLGCRFNFCAIQETNARYTLTIHRKNECVNQRVFQLNIFQIPKSETFTCSNEKLMLNLSAIWHEMIWQSFWFLKEKAS